jgi:3-phytase
MSQVGFSEFIVSPYLETTPMPHSGDSADDPAFWVHPQNPSLSLILGTNKQGALHAYSAQGLEIFASQALGYNNVDTIADFMYQGQPITLIAATLSSGAGLDFYLINLTQERFEKIGSLAFTKDGYGLCFYRDLDTQSDYIFVTSRKKNTEQYLVYAAGEKIQAQHMRSLNISSKNEGCVADSELNKVYIAEEEQGIWTFDARPHQNSNGQMLVGVHDFENIQADIEGLAIYSGFKKKLLIASIQGLDEFAVFDLISEKYLDSFKIKGVGDVDSVTHTDGIDIISKPLLSPSPGSLLIVQDDSNTDLGEAKNQNFKFVAFSQVLEKLEQNENTKP